MRERDITPGAVLYWDRSKSWRDNVTDDPAHRVVVTGRFGWYQTGPHRPQPSPQPGVGRQGVLCHSDAFGAELVVLLAQLRGLYADVMASNGRDSGVVGLTDTQYQLLRMLVEGGTLHRRTAGARGHFIRHPHLGTVPVRKASVDVLAAHGFIVDDEQELPPTWWHDLLLTEAGKAWYAANPRAEKTL